MGGPIGEMKIMINFPFSEGCMEMELNEDLLVRISIGSPRTVARSLLHR